MERPESSWGKSVKIKPTEIFEMKYRLKDSKKAMWFQKVEVLTKEMNYVRKVVDNIEYMTGSLHNLLETEGNSEIGKEVKKMLKEYSKVEEKLGYDIFDFKTEKMFDLLASGFETKIKSFEKRILDRDSADSGIEFINIESQAENICQDFGSDFLGLEDDLEDEIEVKSVWKIN